MSSPDLRGAGRIMRYGLGLAGAMFVLETSISHLLAVLGSGWDSPLRFSLWFEHLGVYLALGVATAIIPVAGYLIRSRNEPPDARTAPDAFCRLTGWSLLAVYSTLLLGPRLKPALGSLTFLLPAMLTAGTGFFAAYAAFRRPGGGLDRGLEVLCRTGLLFLGIGGLVNLRLLGGSIVLPRNLMANGLLLLVCLVVSLAVRGWAGRRSSRARRAAVIVLTFGYATLALAAARATDDLELRWSDAASPGLNTSGDRPDLLLVIIDTLRADRLGCYGDTSAHTPNLDALAADSTRYADHLSASPWTYPSVASILTGRSPSVHQATLLTEVLGQRTDRGRFGARPLRAELPTLATLLHAQGYQTALIGTNPYLTGVFGFDRGFDHYQVLLRSGVRYVTLAAAMAGVGWRPLEPLDPTLTATEMTDRFIAWLDQPRRQPRLLVAHYMDPHFPYQPPARFREGLGAPPTDRVRPIGRLSRFYAGEVAYVDEQLGRLLGHLKSTGQLEHTVVAVTSDHGETFLDHGDWVSWEEMPDGFDPYATRGVDHGQSVYQELIHVPLIIHRPGQTGRVVTGMTRAIDLMPTLLAAVGVTPPEGLLPIVDPPLELPALAESLLSGREKKAWIEGRFKLIYKPSYPAGERLELYDRIDDPHEKRDLAGTHPRLAAAMEESLVGTLRGLEQPGGADPVALDPELVRKLEALGYILKR